MKTLRVRENRIHWRKSKKAQRKQKETLKNNEKWKKAKAEESIWKADDYFKKNVRKPAKGGIYLGEKISEDSCCMQ